MLPSTLRESKDYPNMFYLVWDDGVSSKSFYNLTWAKHHLKFSHDPNYKFNKRAP